MKTRHDIKTQYTSGTCFCSSDFLYKITPSLSNKLVIRECVIRAVFHQLLFELRSLYFYEYSWFTLQSWQSFKKRSVGLNVFYAFPVLQSRYNKDKNKNWLIMKTKQNCRVIRWLPRLIIITDLRSFLGCFVLFTHSTCQLGVELLKKEQKEKVISYCC